MTSWTSYMMPFHRRRFVAPLKTDKHEVTWSNLAADMGTATVSVTLATCVASEDKGAGTECMVGSHVRSVYVEMNIAAETVTNPKVLHWVVECRDVNQTGTTPSLYYQDDRSIIIKRGMEMLPKDVSTVFKRIFVVRIPKKAQRMSMGAGIFIKFRCSSTESINVCGFGIYKEQY